MSDRATCKSCGAPIVWAFTKKGNRIPLDYEPVESGNFRLTEKGPIWEAEIVEPMGEPLYVSHFATCPDSDSWRKTK